MNGWRLAPGRRCVRRLAYPVFLFGVYFCALLFFGNMWEAPAVSATLSLEYPQLDQAKEITERLEEEGESQVCFYWDGGLVTVREKGYGRQAQVLLGGLWGDASLYDPRVRNLSPEDQDGCILDRKTAEELFGSGDAVGREIFVGDRSYVVREVVAWKSRLLLMHPDQRETAFTKLFVRKKDGETGESTLSRMLMRCGLSGRADDTGVLKTGARAALGLFPGAVFLSMLLQAYRAGKSGEGTRAERRAWSALFYGGLLFGVFLLWKWVRIPADWLPSRWSDFQFWPDKLHTEYEKIKLYLMLPKTAMQAENLLSACTSTLFSILSVIFYVAFRRKEA